MHDHCGGMRRHNDTLPFLKGGANEQQYIDPVQRRRRQLTEEGDRHLLIGANVASWIWALVAFQNYPILLGTATKADRHGQFEREVMLERLSEIQWLLL